MHVNNRLKKKLIAAFLALAFSICAVTLSAQEEPLKQETQVSMRKVAVIPLEDVVDWHMLATLKRRLGEAKTWGAHHYIFEINSYGGYLDATEDITDVLSELTVSGSKTTAYVVNKALSGGAYIAMACDEIAMQPHASFGDVMPILMTLQDLPADIKEKSRSPVRAKFANYATQHGYPVALAKAMVDPDIEVVRVVLSGQEGDETYYIEGRNVEEWVRQKTEVEGYREKPPREVVVAVGQLLTMGASDAHEYGFSKYTVPTRTELLEELAGAYYTQVTGEVKAVAHGEVFEVSVYQVTWWEGFIRFLTLWYVKGLLLLVGLLGLYVEFKIPGFGAPGIVGIACIMLVLFGSYAVGLASVIELMMIGAGLVLLAMEIFVIPGFGVAGISGMLLLAFGILLSFQKGLIPETPFETSVFRENIVVLVTSFLVFVAAAVLLARWLPKTKQFSKIALDGPGAGTVHGDAAVQARLRDFVGKAGIATTTLRPAGKAKIEGQLVDVVTQGDFLEKDIRIRVLRVEGNRIVVVPEAGEES